MAQRRFGPTRGAGVAIIELEGEKGIEPGALGMVGYAGVFEKGPVGELIIATKKTQFSKKMGSYIPDSLAPDCALDYYDLANGAGGLLLIRITDGNELQSEMLLYARNALEQSPMGKIQAANGGRWGGKEQRHTDDMAAAGDLADTTLDTGSASFTTDQWKGGWIELDELPNYRFPVTGNTSAGIITVAADQQMKTLWTTSGGGDLRYHLVLENEDKALSIEIGDGEDNPTTEFSLSVYVDDAFVKKYPNLSTDPNSSRYWVSLINDDGGNDEIFVTDLWTGAHTAATRPSNHYGLIDTGLTATVMPAVIHQFKVTFSPTGADPTATLDASDDVMIAQVITITMTSATAFDAVSDKFGALGSGVEGVAFVPNTKWAPEFTITNGATILATADVMKFTYKPFAPSTLVGGHLYPDKVNAKNTKFRIVANDHDSITVADGSDLTVDGAVSDEFMAAASLELQGGRDGHADLVDADYNQQAWDTAGSPFNRVVGKNLGLLKFATPGVISTAVEKAGAAYANAKNHQYRYEIPVTVVTEQGAMEHINDTLGRTEYAVAAFPSWCSVPDPEAVEPGKLKSTPNTGMIHGREARIAADFDGYHKAEAGVDAILPKILKIPTGDAILDEEQLNPVGIAIIKKVKGNFIIWGDRTLHLDPTWKWKHQRELMSYYEHVLQENFDWIVFAINDPVTEKIALAALNSYFEPEWAKRALRGATFQEAAIIKVDEEINTDATRAAGDMFAEVKLKLADTVERFIIKIGKQGIFESVG